MNPRKRGTKAAFHYVLTCPPAARCAVRLRLSRATRSQRPFDDSTTIVEARRQRGRRVLRVSLQPSSTDADARHVQRQAFAGMIWSKQFYHYDVPRWLDGDPAQPPPPAERRQGRNHDWTHLEQCRHHLHARQVGISLVRRLGSGVSLHHRWR